MPNVSRARLRRVLAACLCTFFGGGRGQKQAISVCVVLPHFASTERNLVKNTNSRLKNAKFSCAHLRRALATCFVSFLAGVRPKSSPFCKRHFRYRTKLRPKTHTHSLKNAQFFSHTPSARARGLFFLPFWPRARLKISPFVCVVCHILRCSAKLGQKHILAGYKTPNCSRARLRRARATF